MGFAQDGKNPQYNVWCLEYCCTSEFPVSQLLFGTRLGEEIERGTMNYCYIKGQGMEMLFDTGHTYFDFGTTGRRGKVYNHIDPKTSLGRLNVNPKDIQIIVLSHLHWDHANGIAAFPNATIYIQKREIEFAAGLAPQWGYTRRAIFADDVIKIVELNWRGKVKVVDGDVTIAPGITCYLAPGHSPGNQFCAVNTEAGTVVLASDVVPLYQNLREMIPLGFGMNFVEMLESFEKVKSVMGPNDRLLVPGHDVEVFERFPKVAKGVVQIA